MLSVIAGAQRFAHANQLRADRALHALLGMSRFPSDDTILNYFRRFNQAQIELFWRPLWRWLIGRLPGLVSGYAPPSLPARHSTARKHPRLRRAMRRGPTIPVKNGCMGVHRWQVSGNYSASFRAKILGETPLSEGRCHQELTGNLRPIKRGVAFLS